MKKSLKNILVFVLISLIVITGALCKKQQLIHSHSTLAAGSLIQIDTIGQLIREKRAIRIMKTAEKAKKELLVFIRENLEFASYYEDMKNSAIIKAVEFLEPIRDRLPSPIIVLLGNNSIIKRDCNGLWIGENILRDILAEKQQQRRYWCVERLGKFALGFSYEGREYKKYFQMPGPQYMDKLRAGVLEALEKNNDISIMLKQNPCEIVDILFEYAAAENNIKPDIIRLARGLVVPVLLANGDDRIRHIGVSSYELDEIMDRSDNFKSWTVDQKMFLASQLNSKNRCFQKSPVAEKALMILLKDTDEKVVLSALRSLYSLFLDPEQARKLEDSESHALPGAFYFPQAQTIKTVIKMMLNRYKDWHIRSEILNFIQTLLKIDEYYMLDSLGITMAALSGGLELSDEQSEILRFLLFLDYLKKGINLGTGIFADIRGAVLVFLSKWYDLEDQGFISQQELFMILDDILESIETKGMFIDRCIDILEQYIKLKVPYKIEKVVYFIDVFIHQKRCKPEECIRFISMLGRIQRFKSISTDVRDRIHDLIFEFANFPDNPEIFKTAVRCFIFSKTEKDAEFLKRLLKWPSEFVRRQAVRVLSDVKIIQNYPDIWDTAIEAIEKVWKEQSDVLILMRILYIIRRLLNNLDDDSKKGQLNELFMKLKYEYEHRAKAKRNIHVMNELKYTQEVLAGSEQIYQLFSGGLWYVFKNNLDQVKDLFIVLQAYMKKFDTQWDITDDESAIGFNKSNLIKINLTKQNIFKLFRVKKHEVRHRLIKCSAVSYKQNEFISRVEDVISIKFLQKQLLYVQDESIKNILEAQILDSKYHLTTFTNPEYGYQAPDMDKILEELLDVDVRSRTWAVDIDNILKQIEVHTGLYVPFITQYEEQYARRVFESGDALKLCPNNMIYQIMSKAKKLVEFQVERSVLDVDKARLVELLFQKMLIDFVRTHILLQDDIYNRLTENLSNPGQIRTMNSIIGQTSSDFNDLESGFNAQDIWNAFLERVYLRSELCLAERKNLLQRPWILFSFRITSNSTRSENLNNISRDLLIETINFPQASETAAEITNMTFCKTAA